MHLCNANPKPRTVLLNMHRLHINTTVPYTPHTVLLNMHRLYTHLVLPRLAHRLVEHAQVVQRRQRLHLHLAARQHHGAVGGVGGGGQRGGRAPGGRAGGRGEGPARDMSCTRTARACRGSTNPWARARQGVLKPMTDGHGVAPCTPATERLPFTCLRHGTWHVTRGSPDPLVGEQRYELLDGPRVLDGGQHRRVRGQVAQEAEQLQGGCAKGGRRRV